MSKLTIALSLWHDFAKQAQASWAKKNHQDDADAIVRDMLIADGDAELAAVGVGRTRKKCRNNITSKEQVPSHICKRCVRKAFGS